MLLILLGIYPRKLKTYVHRKTCTWMFTAALFVIARKWKQVKCPSADEWINKTWSSPYNGIVFGHKNQWHSDPCYNTHEYCKQSAKWKRPITKRHILWFHLHARSTAVTSTAKDRLVVTQGCGSGVWGVTAKEYEVSLERTNMFQNWSRWQLHNFAAILKTPGFYILIDNHNNRGLSQIS